MMLTCPHLVDDELEHQASVFMSVEEELQAMDDALEDMHVHPDDYGVYAGDIEVQLEDMYDSVYEQEQADNEQLHGDNEHEQADNEQFHGDNEHERTDNEHEQADNEHEQVGNERFHGDNEHEQSNNEKDHGDKFKNLTEAQRSGICTELLARSVLNRQRHLTLPKNATREVANMFHVSKYKVRRVWRRVKECRRLGIPVDVRSRKPQNCGRKRIEIDLSTVPDIPRSQRRTIRSLARALGVKK
jgi:hypothetical protein